MSVAKQKLLKSVLRKTQNQAEASEASSNHSETSNFRERWNQRKAQERGMAHKQHQQNHQEQHRISDSKKKKKTTTTTTTATTDKYEKPRKRLAKEPPEGGALNIRERYEATLRGKAFRQQDEFERGYQSFLQELQNEVSGQHSQVSV